eukprot:scaffold11260_cov105-Isochrysis_galbana.AAC.2
MRCPGCHRAAPTTGSGGPCAGPQVPVQTLWPNLGFHRDSAGKSFISVYCQCGGVLSIGRQGLRCRRTTQELSFYLLSAILARHSHTSWD